MCRFGAEEKLEERNGVFMTGMSQNDMDKLFRELRLTRIVSIISSLLALSLLVLGGYFAHTVKGTLREAEPVMEKIAELDVESLNATLDHINETLETVDLEPIVLTIEELSKALKNLNDAADIIKKISQSLSLLTSIFP